MRDLKCLFCKKITTIHKINAQKKINGKVITVTNSPVYYCADCKETFLSKEAQDVFSYIKENSLDRKGIIFSFEELSRKVD